MDVGAERRFENISSVFPSVWYRAINDVTTVARKYNIRLHVCARRIYVS